MKQVAIRLANEHDAATIALLGRITFSETFGHYFRDRQDLLDYFERTFSVDKIAASLLKPNNVFWIAFADKLPVGYAKLKLNSKSEFVDSENICQLQKIYVLKDFLSAKIGFKLQNLLLEKAKELGYETIWLSVLNENERAINFYLRNGFTKVGDHEFRIGKERFDFIAMFRNL